MRATREPPEPAEPPDFTVAFLVHIGRHDAKLSIRELARRAGVPASQVSRVEREEILKPSEDFLRSVARALGKPVEPLLYLAGHITGEEFAARTEAARAHLEHFATAYGLVDADIRDGRTDEAAQVLFFAPGVAEVAGAFLSLGGQGEEGAVRDLLAMWQAMTPDRRRGVLAYASDQEALSEADRRGASATRYRVKFELEEVEKL